MDARYKILCAIYRRFGLVDVPLIGPKGNGKRNCVPGFRAQIDVLGGMAVKRGVFRLPRTLYGR